MPRSVVAVLLAAVVAIAVAAILLAVGGETAEIAALVLIGLAAVAVTSTAFYLVGLSEDRDRRRRTNGS